MTDYCNAMASGAADVDASGDTESGEDSSTDPEGPARSIGDRLHWWSEVAIIGAFYGVYTLIRNQFGSELGSSVKQAAIDNAYDMIGWSGPFTSSARRASRTCSSNGTASSSSGTSSTGSATSR